jgi:hypothetical protein
MYSLALFSRGKNMLKIISLVFLSLISLNSNAFLITNYKAQEINYNLPTRLLIAGAGDDLGIQFQEVAKAKAMLYRDLNPDYQIILITAEEKEVDNKNVLSKWGFSVRADRREKFDGETLVEEVIKYSKIASLDVFSHSSAQYGVHLDGKMHRLSLNTKGVDRIKNHFIKDAYAYLHGCNTGFNLAPYLSKIWGIPVAGSMTSTNFQKLHSDGQFYLTEAGFSPNSDWAKENNKSYSVSRECRDGACLRLKPDNHPYVGFWGEYAEGGLPFYKFFCAKNSPTDCQRVMAKSLLNFIGTSPLKPDTILDEYKKIVKDFLCPISAKNDLRNECEENLENALVTGDETYNPFSRTQVECDFISCKLDIVCKKIPFTGIYKPGTCSLENHFNGKSTTLVREYKAYLEGFKYLNN